MRYSSFDLGPVPCDESCEQVGPNYNSHMARGECHIYKDQLLRMFPDIPEGCRFKTVHQDHDFGEYVEVHIVYDESVLQCIEYALNVEGNLPDKWDDKAKHDLAYIRQNA